MVLISNYKKRLLFGIACGLFMGTLESLYSWMQRTWGGEMLQNGTASIWWFIVLLCFVGQTCILLAAVGIWRRYLNSDTSKSLPSFWQASSEIVPVVFLFRLARVLSQDHVRSSLRNVGLGRLYVVVLGACIMLIFVAGARLRNAHAEVARPS